MVMLWLSYYCISFHIEDTGLYFESTSLDEFNTISSTAFPLNDLAWQRLKQLKSKSHLVLKDFASVDILFLMVSNMWMCIKRENTCLKWTPTKNFCKVYLNIYDLVLILIDKLWCRQWQNKFISMVAVVTDAIVYLGFVVFVFRVCLYFVCLLFLFFSFCFLVVSFVSVSFFFFFFSRFLFFVFCFVCFFLLLLLFYCYCCFWCCCWCCETLKFELCMKSYL